MKTTKFVSRALALAAMFAAGAAGAKTPTDADPGAKDSYTKTIVVTANANNIAGNATDNATTTLIHIKNTAAGYFGGWCATSFDDWTMTGNTAGPMLADIHLNSGTTFTINNGGSGAIQTFCGAWTGAGNFEFGTGNNPPKCASYVFLGDMSQYSGNITRPQVNGTTSFTAALAGSTGILQFGTTTAFSSTSHATITVPAAGGSVSGTGAISTAGLLRYEYAAEKGPLTVGNSSVTAKLLDFTGGATYTVSANLAGKDATAANNTLRVNMGTATLTGRIANFGKMEVSSGATLDFSGAKFDLTSFNAPGEYTLVTFTGEGTHTAWNTLTADNFLNPRYELTIGDEGKITLAGDPKSTNLTWNPNTSGNWNTTALNWRTDEGIVCKFLNGDSAKFADTVAGHNVTLQENITANAVTVGGSGIEITPVSYTLTANSFSVEENKTATFSVTKTSAANLHLGAVSLESGAVINQKPSDITTAAGALTFDSLTLKGNATLRNNDGSHATSWNINGLSSEGAGNRVLTLDDKHASNAPVVFNFAGDATASAFTGEIDVQQNKIGNARHLGVVIGNETILENAVVHYSNSIGTGQSDAVTQLSLAVNTANAKVAGLSTEGLSLGQFQTLDVFSGAVKATGSGNNNGTTFFVRSATPNTLEIANTGDYTFSGNFGSVNITKSGEGTQNLAGNVTGSDIKVKAGTLAFTGAGKTLSDIKVSEGAIKVASGASVTLGGTVELASAVVNEGTVAVTASTVFELGSMTPTAEGVYTLISGGTVSGWDTDTLTKASFTINGEAIGASQAIDISTSGAVKIVEGSAAIVWKGGEGAVWNNDGESNKVWREYETQNETYFSTGDNVFFTSAEGTKTVKVAADVAAGSVVVESGEYTFASDNGSTIAAAEILIKEGATLTLPLSIVAGGNTSHIVNEGTLNLTGEGVFTLNHENGGTINVGEGITVNAAPATIGTANVVAGGTINLGALTSSGVTLTTISGAGKIQMTLGTDNSNKPINIAGMTGFTGEFELVGTETDPSTYTSPNLNNNSIGVIYSGGINAATFGTSATLVFAKSCVVANDTQSIGAKTIVRGSNVFFWPNDSATVTFSDDVTVEEGAKLTIGNGPTVFNNLVQNGGAVVFTPNNNKRATTINAGVQTAGTMSGARPIIKATEGTLTLKGGNALTGKITVNGGVLDLTENTFTTDRANGGWEVNGGTVKVASHGRENSVVTSMNDYFFMTNLTLKAGGVLEVTTAQQNTNAGGAYRGFQVTQGTGIYKYTGAENSSLINHDQLDPCRISVVSGATAEFDVVEAGVTLAVSKKIDGAGAISKVGAGTLNMSYVNTFTGGVMMREGTVYMGSYQALGTGEATFAGGTLHFGNWTYASNIPNNFSVGDGVTGTIEIEQGGSAVLQGNITGAGSIVKTGPGTINLGGTSGGNNTFTGGLTVREGVVAFNWNTSLGAGTVTLDGGTIRGTKNYQNAIPNNFVLTANNGTIDLPTGYNATFAGAISGEGSLTKTGAATLTLNGASTFTGGTVVSAGKLTVGNVDALGNGAVTVAAGATLNITNAPDENGKLLAGTSFTINGAVTKGDVAIAYTIKSDGLYLVSEKQGGKIVVPVDGEEIHVTAGTTAADVKIVTPDGADPEAEPYDITEFVEFEITSANVVSVGGVKEEAMPNVTTMAMPSEGAAFTLANAKPGLWYSVVISPDMGFTTTKITAAVQATAADLEPLAVGEGDLPASATDAARYFKIKVATKADD